MDSLDQQIPQESQPSRQSYTQRSHLGQVVEIKTIHSINFLYATQSHFPAALKSLMNHKFLNGLRLEIFYILTPSSRTNCIVLEASVSTKCAL